MGRGAWRAGVHGIAKSRTQLSNFTSLLHVSKRVLQPPVVSQALNTSQQIPFC